MRERRLQLVRRRRDLDGLQETRSNVGASPPCAVEKLAPASKELQIGLERLQAGDEDVGEDAPVRLDGVQPRAAAEPCRVGMLEGGTAHEIPELTLAFWEVSLRQRMSVR